MLIIVSETKTYAFLSVSSVECDGENAVFTVRSEGRDYIFRVPIDGAKGETIVQIFVGKDGKTEIPAFPECGRPRRGKLSAEKYDELVMEFEDKVWDLYRELPVKIARGFGC